MSVARTSHTATLLPDGKVLLAGGGSTKQSQSSSAEIYDPQSRTFSATGSMSTARSQASATLLPRGNVLIAGGSDSTGAATDAAEIYDPSTGQFRAIAQKMTNARTVHTATLLPTGEVLLAGGCMESCTPSEVLATAELYDPSSESFAPTALLNHARGYHSATVLLGGWVLFAGGQSSGCPTNACATATLELYDWRDHTFKLLAANLPTSRLFHTATLLATGQVLLTGGHDGVSYVDSADLVTPKYRTRRRAVRK
jgi:WD40 repeat protein